MSSRILNAAIAVALAAIAYVAFAMPAAAEQRTLRVQLANGSLITVQVDAPCVPLNQIPGLPGTAVADLDPSVCAPDVPAVPTTPTSPSNPTTPTQPATPTTPTNPTGGGGK